MDTARRKEIFIFAAFAIIAVIGLALFMFRGQVPGGGRNPVVTNVDPGKAPEQFPAIPISADATVINNFNSLNPSGKMQATRSFENKNDVEANFAFYKQFLADPKNGWTIVSEENSASDPSHKTIFARNIDGVLVVNISVGRTAQVSLVDTTFLRDK